MTDSGWPDIETAERLWQEGINFRLQRDPIFVHHDEYIFHTRGVAGACATIAALTSHLDPDKAFVLGLLHDYGKRYNERMDQVYHVRDGYQAMTELGYHDCARICLTHSYSKPDFDTASFNFPPEWLQWAKDTMKTVIQDDYDRLVQLCDLFFEGLNIVPFESRLAGIQKRYQLSQPLTELYNHALENKHYFENLCGIDIYDLLGIKND